jgi:DNA-binding NarL/FixJ family response regulator
MNPSEFIQQHAPEGEMTAAQAAQLLELVDQGDTGAESPEQGSAPDAAPAAAAPEAVQATTNEQNTDGAAPSTETEPDPAKAVLLAKDGIHTIPYERLVEARQGKQVAEMQAQEALQKLQAKEQELNALRQQAQQRADAGIAPTSTDQNLAAAEAAIEAGVDPDLFGDFSEEALAKGIRKLVSMDLPKLVEQLVQKQLEPLHQERQESVHDAHAKALYEAHPDLDSIVESKELQDWVASQPSYARPGIEQVLKEGTTDQVIELFNSFKEATGKAQAAAPTPSVESVKAAAAKAVAAAKPPIPASLTDIPGGTPGPATGHEALANLSAVDQLEALAGKTPEQIEAWLNRSL